MNIQGNILEANGFLSFGERFGLTSNLPTCNNNCPNPLHYYTGDNSTINCPFGSGRSVGGVSDILTIVQSTDKKALYEQVPKNKLSYTTSSDGQWNLTTWNANEINTLTPSGDLDKGKQKQIICSSWCTPVTHPFKHPIDSNTVQLRFDLTKQSSYNQVILSHQYLKLLGAKLSGSSDSNNEKKDVSTLFLPQSGGTINSGWGSEPYYIITPSAFVGQGYFYLDLHFGMDVNYVVGSSYC